jgi:hypothetical protein
MQHLSSKTIKELEQYAQENNVDLKGAKTKTRILAILLGMEAEVVEVPAQEQIIIKSKETVKRTPQSSSATNKDNAVISKGAEKMVVKKETMPKEEKQVDKVAVYSEKNMRWGLLGTLSMGYNIVNKEEAEKWLTLKAVRKATPQEVATHYGKV